MLFSLGTHRELFGSVGHADEGETPALRENIDSLKAHVRQMVAIMEEELAKSRELG